MDVFGVNNIPDPKDSGRIKKVQERKNNGLSAAKNSASPDAVVISEQARSAFKEKNYMPVINELPDVRNDAVEKAKSELASGKLFSEDVIRKTAEKLMGGIEDLY